MGIKPLGGGRWQIIAKVRVNGKPVPKQLTISGTKEEAKETLERLKKEIRTGGSRQIRSLKLSIFSDVLNVYIEHDGPFCSSYTAQIEKMKSECGNYPLHDFVFRFDQFLKSEKATEDRSPAWYNRRVAITRAAFQACYLTGKIDSNPITAVLFPKLKEIPRDVVLSPDQISNLILTAAKNRRTCHIARYLQYIFQVPCRKSEIVNTVVSDIDLFNNVIRIRNGETKSGAGTWKPIPPDMKKWFIRRVKIASSIAEPIFYREDSGECLPLGDFKNAWHTVREACGLPDLRIHDTRHVSATELVDNGTPEQVVMQVAGWKTNMLKTYYNRNPKKALELVQFSKRGGIVAVSENKCQEKKAGEK